MVGEYRIAISKQYSLPILVRKKNAPSVRLVVSILTCKSNKKRSTGVLANQVARVVSPTFFHGTSVVWGHFGVLYSWRRSIFFTLSSVCDRRSNTAPFLAFLGQLPPYCLSSSGSHALWNTIPPLFTDQPISSWPAHPSETFIHLPSHFFPVPHISKQAGKKNKIERRQATRQGRSI